ncbi:hypothetical protein M885DRAFT_189840 [Pelagophyceae sp. CCMP2097]|nr:hypothetical protein M885DRAFT_189840 [Pelagophyceae sp. CCMP2097]
MAKKRKAQPLVPPAKRPATLKAAAASVEASVEAPAATVCLESAVVWLESALRVADNAALARAAARGPGGLAVIVVWRHGVKNPTPATSFQAHALRALGSDLRARGSRLTVLRSDDASNAAAAAVVAAFVAKAQKTPALVVVDAGGGAAADTDAAACLIAALASKDLAQVQVEGIRDDALLSHDELEACLPYGADGEVRRVNWAGFLEASKGLPLIPAKEAPLKLPPPVAKDQGLATDDQGLPADSKWWCDAVVANWLDLTQAPMSSAGGLALAARAGALATQSGRGGFGRGAGERGGAAEDADGRGQPAPAYLSPYLRWGVVSPRQAAASGVRRRDLLWRDFSRVCWRHFPALQEGTPVNADSADLWDYKTKAPFGECEAPHWDNDRVGKWTPELSGGAEGGARPGGASDAAETGASAAAASWSAGCTTSEAFEAWCVGRTGAPLVDAGMKQLWRCGWMPRRIRLSPASGAYCQPGGSL